MQEVVRGHSALPGQFLSRRCFTLCITVEVEPRIAKYYSNIAFSNYLHFVTASVISSVEAYCQIKIPSICLEKLIVYHFKSNIFQLSLFE